MPFFSKSLLVVGMALSVALTYGCASQFTEADPVVSEYRATVLTRGLTHEKGPVWRVSHIDKGRGIDHAHYARVSHVRAGFRTIEMECTNKYAISMNMIVREREYLLEPGQCYVPYNWGDFTFTMCDVTLQRVPCSELMELRNREQERYALPAEHRGWVETTHIP